MKENDLTQEMLDLPKYLRAQDYTPEEYARLKSLKARRRAILNRQAAKRHYEENKAEVRAYRNDWKSQNMDKWAMYQRRHKLKQNYDLTVDEWYEMLSLQGNCCAICKSTEPRHNRNWNVDHDHNTGKIRGILCGPCNTGIGLLVDNVETLNSAIRYLTSD